MSENPMRHIASLRDCLSSHKRPLAVLLGAGCPLAVRDNSGNPIIPAVDGLTDAVRTAVEENQDLQEALGRIDEQFKADGRGRPNVEDLLTHVRALRQAAGSQEARGLGAKTLDELDAKICAAINAVVAKELPAGESAYCNLARWIRALSREFPVELFTTNYDLLLEQSLERERAPYFDGFAGGLRPRLDLRAMEDDELPSRWSRVWKLHGSINWFLDDRQSAVRSVAAAEEASDRNTGARRLIHPSHLKYQESRRLPYLAMMDRLRSFLRKENATLVVCGFSFRDEHINEILEHGLGSNPGSVAFALMYGSLADYEDAKRSAMRTANLTVLARDAAVVGAREVVWDRREKAPDPSDRSIRVEWTSEEAGANPAAHHANLRLGDFARFTDLLADIVGGRDGVGS